MGKGDIRSRKGKIWRGTYGVSRLSRKKNRKPRPLVQSCKAKTLKDLPKIVSEPVEKKVAIHASQPEVVETKPTQVVEPVTETQVTTTVETSVVETTPAEVAVETHIKEIKTKRAKKSSAKKKTKKPAAKKETKKTPAKKTTSKKKK